MDCGSEIAGSLSMQMAVINLKEPQHHFITEIDSDPGKLLIYTYKTIKTIFLEHLLYKQILFELFPKKVKFCRNEPSV